MLYHIDGSNTYVLGSIHITNTSHLVLPATAESAFASSTHVVFEADLDAASDRSMLKLPHNEQLASVVPDALFVATRRHWLRLGLAETQLFALRPAFAAMTLMFTQAAQRGYQVSLGVDRTLWERAKKGGKAIDELESIDGQLTMLANSPLAEQVSQLDYIVRQEDLGLSELADLVSAWTAGDVEHFEVYLKQRMRLWPATFEALVSNRNRSWLPSVVSMARDGTRRVIVVGILHLFGQTGLPTLLADQGIHLSRFDKKNA